MDNFASTVIREQINDIDQQISLLASVRKNKEREWIRIFQEEAKEYIGKCYYDESRGFIKIISVPPAIITMSGTRFNEYQFPAIILTEDLVPFEYDTYYVGPRSKGNEIRPEEFDQEIKKRADRFLQLVVHGADLEALTHFGDSDYWLRTLNGEEE